MKKKCLTSFKNKHGFHSHAISKKLKNKIWKFTLPLHACIQRCITTIFRRKAFPMVNVGEFVGGWSCDRGWPRIRRWKTTRQMSCFRGRSFMVGLWFWQGGSEGRMLSYKGGGVVVPSSEEGWNASSVVVVERIYWPYWSLTWMLVVFWPETMEVSSVVCYDLEGGGVRCL